MRRAVGYTLHKRHRINVPLHLGSAVQWLVAKVQDDPAAVGYLEWQALVEMLYGDVWQQEKVQQRCTQYSHKLGCPTTPHILLFALHTIYGLLARAVFVHRWSEPQRQSGTDIVSSLTDAAFFEQRWGVRNLLPELWDEGLRAFCGEDSFKAAFRAVLALAQDIAARTRTRPWQNVFTDLYEAILSRSIRHDLGEYFTPDWLAEATIEMSGYRGEADSVLFDPGCGSGAFLLAAAEMKRQATGRVTSALLDDVLHNVIGCDINPLSVLTARLNLLWWLAEYFEMPLSAFDLPVLQYDTVFATPLGSTLPDALRKVLPDGCDYLVGNPPWINWNALPPAYRQKLERELLPRYILFDFQGQEAQLGHSNDDYLVTFSFVTIDRYLRPGGLCSFIVKQPLLTNVSGKTFRHFAIRRLQREIPLRVCKVADLRQVNPFGIANETAIVVLQKGERTVYPVPYEIWRHPEPVEGSKNLHQIEVETGQARPASESDVTSPWVVLTPALEETRFMEGRCPYEIRHGLKHDVADVLMVQIVAQSDGTLVVAPAGRSLERYEIEPDVLFPFLQPRHLAAWTVKGYAYAIIPQRKAGENNEREVRQTLPLTYSYLKRFEAAYAARRSRVFSGTPFYGLFGLGDYTWAPYKVCWCGLGFRPEFAVAEPVADGFVGTKPLVPDGTVYFIPTSDRTEAHFLCAILNAEIVRTFLSARSSKSKRGLAKKLMQQLRLPVFRREDERHLRLAKASIGLHQEANRHLSPSLPAGLNKVVVELFQAEPLGQLTLF
ncbi:MAG TPA: hypothetical protein EYP49_15225 [Anaerolineae bacterium]|nr:hypothetical protein [Anaerolineae bacterium]